MKKKIIKIVQIGRARFRFEILKFLNGKMCILFHRIYADGRERFGYFGNQPTLKQAFAAAKYDSQLG